MAPRRGPCPSSTRSVPAQKSNKSWRRHRRDVSVAFDANLSITTQALKEALRGPKVTQCQGWDGQGRLAPYAELKETMTQTYRLLGEECVVQGCTNKVDAPKYVMELVGGPVCMACGQKIVLQEFRGKSAKPFEPEFEQPTHEDIVRAKEAGLKLPAWAEEALAAEGG